jgi:hypothetical protein
MIGACRDGCTKAEVAVDNTAATSIRLWTLSPSHERFRDMMIDQGDQGWSQGTIGLSVSHLIK